MWFSSLLQRSRSATRSGYLRHVANIIPSSGGASGGVALSQCSNLQQGVVGKRVVNPSSGGASAGVAWSQSTNLQQGVVGKHVANPSSGGASAGVAWSQSTNLQQGAVGKCVANLMTSSDGASSGVASSQSSNLQQGVRKHVVRLMHSSGGGRVATTHLAHQRIYDLSKVSCFYLWGQRNCGGRLLHTMPSIVKGTTNVFMRSGNFVFTGADGLGSENGRITRYDLEKIFTFEEDERLFGKVVVMYGGCGYYPELIKKSLWCTPGEINAFTCASFAKGLIDRAIRAAKDKKLHPKPNQALPNDEFFKFNVTFASVDQQNSFVYRLDGDGLLMEEKSFDASFDGMGREMGRAHYDTYFDRDFDATGLIGDAYENYIAAYYEYSLLDIMLACSKDRMQPSGGRIQAVKLSPTGTEILWDNWLYRLFEERETHWQSEYERLRTGIIQKVSPIEWDFAQAEERRLKRGWIGSHSVRTRSYERYNNFQNS